MILTQVIDYLYRDKTQIQETYGEVSELSQKSVSALDDGPNWGATIFLQNFLAQNTK